MVSMADALLLARRQQEETFAAVLATRLGPPGEAWEAAARALGLPWDRFLCLAICRLPRTAAATAALARTFGLQEEVIAALAQGMMPRGEEGHAR